MTAITKWTAIPATCTTWTRVPSAQCEPRALLPGPRTSSRSHPVPHGTCHEAEVGRARQVIL